MMLMTITTFILSFVTNVTRSTSHLDQVHEDTRSSNIFITFSATKDVKHAYCLFHVKIDSFIL